MTKTFTIPTIKFYFCSQPSKPQHGPQIWSWWRLFSLSFLKLDCNFPENQCWRLWVYNRWHTVHFDLYIDRRRLDLYDGA